MLFLGVFFYPVTVQKKKKNLFRRKSYVEIERLSHFKTVKLAPLKYTKWSLYYKI